MPIEVRHDSGIGLAQLASGAGFVQGQVVGREQNRRYEIAHQRVKNEEAEVMASVVRTLIRSNAAAATGGKASVPAENRRPSANDGYSRSSARGGSQEMPSAQPEQEYERIYSASQNQELQRLATARDQIQQNEGGRYSPQEQQDLMMQVLDKETNIVPQMKRKESPYPAGQDVGQAWMDNATGATMTRDDKGQLKVLVKPDDTFTVKNQLDIKKATIEYANQLYETSQVSDNPMPYAKAMETAQQFYTIDVGQTPEQIDPVIRGMRQQASDNVASNFINMTENQQGGVMTMAGGGRGDSESMADHILRQVMSPETYQAAKQTGLPSKDIYYMAQQLSAGKQQADRTAKPVSGDISKSEWMANKQSFGDYRQRYAQGVTKSQIEADYKNDPYIEKNNSSLADPEHEVTTKYATWDELTDSQRDGSYEAYKKWHSSLGFLGRAEHIIGDRTVEKRIEEKNEKEKGKLLTKKQFVQKAKENPEFLWKFKKVSNKEQTLFDNAPTEHKGLDAGRLPVFGGING